VGTAVSPAERSRAGLSLKFQITNVPPALTVYDNMLLALQAQNPLSSLILSHGQQQWLEIAMALAPEPRNDAQLLQ
jgi:branched-chain amino acid transport system ATP-binding protein